MNSKEIKIRTPDQKLRVFVSSTLRELADERKAARSAIENIHLIPVMFELGARPHPPKDLYQAYLEQSHIFIGIYWQSYGWIAENEKISGLEDELLLSEKFPRLIYVKEPAIEREDKLNVMLDYIRSKGNVSYKSFSSGEELSKLIEEDLAILISERFYQYEDYHSKSKKEIKNNLPAYLPQIVGREKEISEISDLILNKEKHLITLTGLGGIGKTRLSQEIGKSVSDSFKDGVFFADFSGVFEEKLIFANLAKVFRISLIASIDNEMQISEFISDKKILLIIDNFEQLSHAGSKISSLVKNCQNLFVIVTSRNPLELSVETEYSIDSLPVPEINTKINEIELSPSVILFAERCRAAFKNFELNEENIYDVSEICRLLGGIPLAIELAAVKVRTLSLKMIKEKLSKKMDILSGSLKDVPDRHKTMKATIEWSYDLLGENEKKLFKRLAVFTDGFDYDAVENICCFDIEDAYDAIESLLTKKFFQKDIEINGLPRFKMLDLLHKYSNELFENSGESDIVILKLTEYYCEKIKKDSAEYSGAVEAKVNSEWMTDIQNVMKALETLNSEKRYIELIEMIYSLWPIFWIFDNNKLLESRIDLSKIIQSPEDINDAVNGKQSWIQGSAAMETSDLEKANLNFNDAYKYFTITNNLRGLAWSNLIVSSLKNNDEKFKNSDEILNAFKISAELFRKCRDYWGESVAMQYIGTFEMERGNFDEAITAFDVSIKIVKEMGSDSLIGYIYSLKALAYMEKENFENAGKQLLFASENFNNDKFDEAVAYYILIMAYYLFCLNDYKDAMLLAGLSKNIFSKYSFTPWHMLSGLFKNIDIYVKSFCEEEFSEEFKKGNDLNVFRALEIASAIIIPKLKNIES